MIPAILEYGFFLSCPRPSTRARLILSLSKERRARLRVRRASIFFKSMGPRFRGGDEKKSQSGGALT